jgi:hypothetical protein
VARKLLDLPTTGSSLDWDFTVSNMFKIPSLPAKKKASKVTCHRLLTADKMFEQKLKEEEEKKLLVSSNSSYPINRFNVATFVCLFVFIGVRLQLIFRFVVVTYCGLGYTIKLRRLSLR